MNVQPDAVCLCVGCGQPARWQRDGEYYCGECMNLHLLERMLVQLTEMQKPKNDTGAADVAEETAQVTAESA